MHWDWATFAIGVVAGGIGGLALSGVLLWTWMLAISMSEHD